MSASRPRRGVCLGKFLPPHRGHQYLVDFARHHCEHLTVLVCTLTREPIPGELRFAWMREMFPQSNVRVVHVADDSLPQVPEEHADFWRIWRDVVREHAGEVEAFYASEPYGGPMAEVLDCEFVPVDIARELVPVSGTDLRRDAVEHWHMLPDVVRPWFARKVCLFGPESTGKSTLARDLARAIGTCYVHEYARPLLDPKGGKCEPADLPKIALGQAAAEDAMLPRCNRVLVTDTDCLTTAIWSDVLFGRVAPVVTELAETRAADLYLLCDVDVPWVDDEQRFFRDQPVRQAMFDRFRNALETRGRRYVTIRGSWDERLEQARRAVSVLLQDQGNAFRLR